MHDLKETTQDLHYENFRAKTIAQISAGSNGNLRERSKLRRDTPPDSPQDLLIQKEEEVRCV
jgi:septin 4